MSQRSILDFFGKKNGSVASSSNSSSISAKGKKSQDTKINSDKKILSESNIKLNNNNNGIKLPAASELKDAIFAHSAGNHDPVYDMETDEEPEVCDQKDLDTVKSVLSVKTRRGKQAASIEKKPELMENKINQNDEDSMDVVIPKAKRSRRIVMDTSDSEEDVSMPMETSEIPEEKNLLKVEEEMMDTEEENDESEEENDENDSDKSSLSRTQIKFVNEDQFNPAIDNFNPLKDACWKQGTSVPYYALAATFDQIESVSSRLKMIEIMANYFWSVIYLSPQDLLPSIYLCLNKLAPDYEGIELGIGESTIMRAISAATGRRYDQVKLEVEKKGDLGSVAESSRTMQKLMFQPPRLMLSNVFNKLKEIALMTGQSSTTKKTEKIQALIIACKGIESRFLTRSLTGKLRIGLAEQSVLGALSQAIVLAEAGKNIRLKKSFKTKLDKVTALVKNAYCQCPSYDRIVDVYLKKGVYQLPSHCSLLPSVPMKPMLAHPTKGIHEVLKRLDKMEFTCEFKYDGERAQIHYSQDDNGIDKINIYSRNQENNTSKYPDVINRLKKTFNDDVKSFILDSEAVAWDLKENKILPFQILSTRKRKDAKEDEITVQVCIYAFDLIYLNGESLIEKSLRDRRDLLRSHFREVPGEFCYATSRDVANTDQIEEFLDESIKGKCEGLMIKTLDEDATYEIAKRSHKWLKLKKDYLNGVGDTLDLVVIGGYIGKGKRTGAYGGFLLACYDEENEEFQSICKIGTGFKDEDLEEHYKFFQEHKTTDIKSYYRCDESMKPDVWFEPVQVWEVKCADLSVSPIYRAAIGIVDSAKGISLRFPRYIRIREDKKPEMATTASQVADMYQNQEVVKNNDPEEEEDY